MKKASYLQTDDYKTVDYNNDTNLMTYPMLTMKMLAMQMLI